MATEIQTLERYFYNDFIMCGKYDIPLVRKQQIDMNSLKLIRFSGIVKNETKDTDATVHFFEFDYKFDEVWKKPDAYVDEIGQYKQTMTPDFSIYINMSRSLQIFNTFRNRKGHLPDTVENRSIIINTARNEANYVGKCKFDNKWYAKDLGDGRQSWVAVRDGLIQNCGINIPPVTDWAAMGVRK